MFIKKKWRGEKYLAIFLGLRSLRSSDTHIHRNLLQEGEALHLREEWCLQLTKIELNRTVVAKNMGEQCLLGQGLLIDLESHTKVFSIFEVGNLHLICFEILCKIKKCTQVHKNM